MSSSTATNPTPSSSSAAPTTTRPHHSAVVLFYKYFFPSQYPLLHAHGAYYEPKLLDFQRQLCERLGCKGRVLLGTEGINGTLSATDATVLNEYIAAMEAFELCRDCGVPPEEEDDESDEKKQPPETEESSGITNQKQPYQPHCLFTDIDWKTSTNDDDTIAEPFPDLKLAIVKEIVNSGNAVQVDEMETNSGKHLTPEEFHEAVQNHADAVLIDVRNTFEYDVGHFVHPATGGAAVNPEMVTFSSFDAVFCQQNAEALKDKKVLMYCTGGIRCEKASVMLRKRGVKDVSQLQGGIHRYIDRFGDKGFFRGQNFVFDQRVGLRPPPSKEPAPDSTDSGTKKSPDIVGQCLECRQPWEELSGDRICTVCRDMILICPSCQERLREYHCRRHAKFRTCYFTFLEVFTLEELQSQRKELLELRESYVPAAQHRNVRRTISKQIRKVEQQIQCLENGQAVANRNAPKRCRTCMEANTVCDGNCWGFWKRKDEPSSNVASNDG